MTTSKTSSSKDNGQTPQLRGIPLSEVVNVGEGQLKKTMDEMQRARKEEAERIELAERDLVGVGEGVPVPILLALAAATATLYVSLRHLENGDPVIFIANALFIGAGIRYGQALL